MPPSKLNQLNNLWLKFGLTAILVLAVVALSGFGCKEEEPVENTEPAPEPLAQTTFNTADIPVANTLTPANQGGEEANLLDNTANEADNAAEGAVTAEDDLLSQAEIITEIYGTFTNKDKEPYKNLKNLESYASPNMQNYINSVTAKPIDPNASFYGQTTKALSSAILEKSASSQKILVTAETEQITQATSSPLKKYTLLLLEFVKIDNEWKLNSAFWQS